MELIYGEGWISTGRSRNSGAENRLHARLAKVERPVFPRRDTGVWGGERPEESNRRVCVDIHPATSGDSAIQTETTVPRNLSDPDPQRVFFLIAYSLSSSVLVKIDSRRVSPPFWIHLFGP